MAVAGLPEPRKDHAVVMARFARDCIQRMNDLSKLLEVSLGPDTGDLALRVGLHSGPVTVGSQHICVPFELYPLSTHLSCHVFCRSMHPGWGLTRRKSQISALWVRQHVFSSIGQHLLYSNLSRLISVVPVTLSILQQEWNRMAFATRSTFRVRPQKI